MNAPDQLDDDDAIAEHAPPLPRLKLGDIELMPYDRHPLEIPHSGSFWCLPGGRIATTFEILRLARKQGLHCSIIINKETV